MIENMKFITLTGPEGDLDRVASEYLSRYEIHLENALSELPGEKRVTAFQGTNPYRDTISKIRSYTDLIPESRLKTLTEAAAGENIAPEDVDVLLSSLKEKLADNQLAKKELEQKHADIQAAIETLKPYREFPLELDKMFSYKYIHSSFGRIPMDFFQKFKNYVYENFNTIFYPCQKDDQYVYGVYFVPEKEMPMVDAVYASMHYERIRIPDGCTGTPAQMLTKLADEDREILKKIEAENKQMQIELEEDAPKLLSIKGHLETLSGNYGIRRMAGLVKHTNGNYYILCGWMAERDAKRFSKELENDPDVICVVEDTSEAGTQPPTKLKNPKLFKPYEMYIEMYGLPNYKELDPTMFVGITYSFIFGIMFGDFGQGLVLLIAGLLLYHLKHIRLAGIIACAGVFSTFFGLMFGSFFGFEDTVIKHVWLQPKVATLTLPGIGSINSILVYAIIFGMFLVLATMIFNIINCHKLGNKEGELFGTNSLVGFIFYVGVIIAMFSAFGALKFHIGIAFAVIFFIIPLLVMFFKEPLTKKITKDKTKSEEGIVMFFVQGFFEMFETMLSFFSNTLSFVRIGAFAVSHAAMMEVVLMLAGVEKGNPNWIAVILGNLFVMGMEGLIVGIQVLRLEYYEMFSRFYVGDGKPFKAFNNKENAA